MKRILVCLDTSPRADGVLDAAIALARATGAKLHLYRAVGLPPDVPAEALSLSPSAVVDLLVGNAARDLEERGRRVPSELLGAVSTSVGAPWPAICAAAREQQVDLIMIGSHGYGKIDHVLGTTAAKVVNHADRSVLVVRGKLPV